MNPFKRIKEELQKIIDVSYYKTVDGTHYAATRNVAYHSVLELIGQVEKDYNNGWIPCSERLPEEYGDYLVLWTDITRKQYYEIAEYEPNNGWIGEIPQAVEGKYSVIAWQPLPVPYKEANNDRY